MRKTLFIISDLHLGGAPGFEMCPEEGRARLVHFIDWVATQKQDRTAVCLILNGDIVDFLAEEDETGFAAFVVDEKRAGRKLAHIMATCENVFAALRRFVASGNRLTLLMGNHDLELSLPAVRRHFLGLLGEGRVAYVYDNEAFTVGPVLIEHGNRYDSWNMVNHNELREVRSQLSRGEQPSIFTAQPGSELVARVMNPVKKKFGFVDLLKPETGAVVPILAVLDPGLWKEAAVAMRESAVAWNRGRLKWNGIPRRGAYVGAVQAEAGPVTPQVPPLSEAIRVPLDEADKAAAAALPAGGRAGYVRGIAVDLLLKTFRAWRHSADVTFNVEQEDETYLAPAQECAKRFRVVVFGHTHLAKRIHLENGALYLNTGTWADVMRIPEAVYNGNEAAGMQALSSFLNDVERNNVTGFRRQIGTFARIELDDHDQVLSADVFFFDDEGSSASISSAGMRERLA